MIYPTQNLAIALTSTWLIIFSIFLDSSTVFYLLLSLFLLFTLILGIELGIASDRHIVQEAQQQLRRTIQSRDEITACMAQALDEHDQAMADVLRDTDELKTVKYHLENVNEELESNLKNPRKEKSELEATLVEKNLRFDIFVKEESMRMKSLHKQVD